MGFVEWSLKSSTTIFVMAVRGQRRKVWWFRERQWQRRWATWGHEGGCCKFFQVNNLPLGRILDANLKDLVVFFELWIELKPPFVWFWDQCYAASCFQLGDFFFFFSAKMDRYEKENGMISSLGFILGCWLTFNFKVK